MSATVSEDQPTENHVDHLSQLSQLSQPSPQTVASNVLPRYGYPQPALLQPGPAQHAPSPYPKYGYSSGLTTPQSANSVSLSKSSAALVPDGVDTTGQIAPPGMKPRVTATLWEDEGSLCFQVEARGICVARREDNHMINGTKLLNVAGMTRGRRDGILKSEKVRHVVKIGPLDLKGVWIPFERALDFANKEKITEMLYPLFVHNIGALLYHPTNMTRTNQVMAAAERRKAEAGGQMRNNSVSGPAPPPGVLPSIQQNQYYHHVPLPDPQPSIPSNNSSGRPLFDRAHTFPTPPTSASSVMESMPQAAMSSAQHPNPMPIDTSLSNARSMPATPAVSDYGESSSPKALDSGAPVRLKGDPDGAETLCPGCEESMEMGSSTSIGKDKNGEGHSFFNEKKRVDPQFNGTSRSSTTEMSTYDNMSEASGECKNAHAQVGNLSPSQNSPQSDSEHSSDSESGLLTRNERRGILVERLMAYFFDLLSSCPSPVPITTAESPMVSNARRPPIARERTAESIPMGMGPLASVHQSMDREALFFQPHPHHGLHALQLGASFFRSYDDRQCNKHDNSPMQDGPNSTAGQSNISASTASIEKRQSNRPIQKRDRKKEGDDEDESQPSKRMRINDVEKIAPKRLACPYFKNDPEHPRLGRSCSGPGWGTVHRIKEHLDRNHALPPSCVRCYTAFDTEADRDTHMRLQDQCQVKERPGRMYGFDALQKEQLRSRPKGYKHMSETQKWCHIYMILFPETASTYIPSPYYEFVSLRDSGHPVDPMIEYENYLRHEMPHRVRQQLELRIEEALNPLEETLRGQIVDIVRDVQLELFQSFRASTRPPRSNGDSVREGAVIEIDDNPERGLDEERSDTDIQNSTFVPASRDRSSQSTPGQSSWEEQMQAYQPIPPLDFSFTGFDGELFDFSSLINVPVEQDSAYGTLSVSQEGLDKDHLV